jgi:mediator of RNA polymerase II transcription subunit 5
MSLKTIAGFLARKPSSLDVMLLFSKPASILQPICNLLDTWRYDEDQGAMNFMQGGTIQISANLF